MSSQPCWDDAMRANKRLSRRDRRTLTLLTRVPFAWTGLLRQLSGVETDRSIYHALNRLTAAGLIGTLCLPWRTTRSPNLAYLTDLGLATLALEHGTTPAALARQYRLRRADLVKRLVGLPPLLATYELLGALAASEAGAPVLHVWDYPWRPKAQSRKTRLQRETSLPGFASLSWEGDEHRAARCMLIADIADRPLASYRSDIARLLRLRDVRPTMVPTLIIATRSEDRVADWKRFLIDLGRARHDSPPSTRIATWEQLRAGIPVPIATPSTLTTDPLRSSTRPPLDARHQANQPLPQFVGAAPLVLASPSLYPGRRERCAVRLTERDRRILDLVGRHPYLTADEIAIVLGCEKHVVSQSTATLVAQGTMRTLTTVEIAGRTDKHGLWELTRAGGEIVAAQHGLSRAQAQRAHGLTGQGCDHLTGQRVDLLRNLAHTLGVNDCFIDLYRVARLQTDAGHDSAVVAWHTAAVCATPSVRPDGYGLYRHHGSRDGFFLEYDRGTMRSRDLVKKFTRYQVYKDSQWSQRHDEGFPLVLVVTVTAVAEERVCRAAQAARDASLATFPLLLTTTERMQHEPLGMVGRVWRDPFTGGEHRYSWLGGHGCNL